MNSLSKPLFDKAMHGLVCSEIFHPWNEKCLPGNIGMLLSCVKGSAVFFSIMYAMGIFLKKGQLSSEQWLTMPISFMRSVLLGTVQGTCFVTGNCIMRKILGRFHYYTVSFFVPLITGLDIVLDDPERRIIVTDAFLTMAIEALLRRLMNTKILSKSIKWQTVAFIIINGLLMYTIRYRMSRKVHSSWFFIPHKVKHKTFDDEANCPHPGPCRLDIAKGSLKYFSVGLVISAARIIMTDPNLIKAPLKLLSRFRRKDFSLPSFAAAYIGLYKIASCLLCRNSKGDRMSYALISGLVSGSAYWFNPSLTIMASAVAVLLKIFGEELMWRNKIPSLPYLQLTFALCNAYLFHTRVMHPQSCPGSMIKMINLISDNRSDTIFKSFEAKIHDYATKKVIC